MTGKDGKCLCFGCGRRVSGLFASQGHASECPIATSNKQAKT